MSPLRKSVTLLREKWTLLMQRVPDIRIQPIANLYGLNDNANTQQSSIASTGPMMMEEDDFLLDSILDEQLGKLSTESSRKPPFSNHPF